MIVKLLNEHHLEFLSLKGGCKGLFKSTHVIATLLGISCTGSYNLVEKQENCSSTMQSSLKAILEVPSCGLKKCRSRSDGFIRSQLIWIYTVTKASRDF